MNRDEGDRRGRRDWKTYRWRLKKKEHYKAMECPQNQGL